ncbi:MAG: hypothetical protein U9Q04_09695 [Campylobacterota bacterium]|nr:hypothetical protein [Campylobacterota bacterium]
MRKNEIDKPDDFLALVKEKKDDYLYHDHPNDGIDLFLDDELEQIGWQSSAFDFITYRDIAEFIEENCEGTITFNDHPMGFNGFVEVDNIEDVREKVKQFIVESIKNNKLEEYDEDQQEAIEFFGVKIS